MASVVLRVSKVTVDYPQTVTVEGFVQIGGSWMQVIVTENLLTKAETPPEFAAFAEAALAMQATATAMLRRRLTDGAGAE